MLVRLILVMLLAAFAMPATAMPGCRAEMRTMPMAADRQMPMAPDHRARVMHVCIGCIAPSNRLTHRIAPVPVAGAAMPIAEAARLVLGTTGPPAPPPPRLR